MSASHNFGVDYRELPHSIDLLVFEQDFVLPDRKVQKMGLGDCFLFSPLRPFKVASKNETYVALTLFERRNADFRWIFDNQTGQALFQMTCSTESARIETLLDLLCRMAGDRIPQSSAVGAFETLSRHDLHFIRWKALQGLGELDGNLAMKRLNEMLALFATMTTRSLLAAVRSVKVFRRSSPIDNALNS